MHSTPYLSNYFAEKPCLSPVAVWVYALFSFQFGWCSISLCRWAKHECCALLPVRFLALTPSDGVSGTSYTPTSAGNGVVCERGKGKKGKKKLTVGSDDEKKLTETETRRRGRGGKGAISSGVFID